MRNSKALIFLLLLTGVVYCNSLFSGFVWDDRPLIIERQAFFSQPRNALELLVSSDSDFRNVKTPYYRPLNTLTYMLDHYLWGGKNPFWYHLENVLLHGVVAALFYMLLIEVFEDGRLAFFAAVLFAIYPANAEAVDAVFNRNVLLCAAFSLASLLFLVKGGLKWVILSLFAYFLALLSKEPAVVVPFFLLSLRLTAREEKFKTNWKALAGFFGVTAVYFIIRHLVLGAFIAGHGTGFSLSRVKLITAVYFEHFRLLVFPFRLNALYTEKAISFNPLKAAAAISGMLLVLYFSLKKKIPGPVRAGAQWIFWGLLPVSNIVKIPSAAVAERYQYTIIFGFVLILGYLVDGLSRKKAALGVAAFAALAIAFGARTFERNFVWHDNISLFSSMISSDPENHLAHYDLCLAYEKRGELQDAAGQYETALALEPSMASARTDLGIVYAEEGHLEKAMQEFKAALATDPDLAKARLNLGVAYAREGRFDDAVRQFRTAVNLAPSMPEAHFALGAGYEKEGLFGEAATEFKKVVELDPGNTRTIEKLDHIKSQGQQRTARNHEE